MNTTKAEHYSQNRSFQHSFGVKVLQQYIKWEEGDTVLDAGCGTGEICNYISQQPGVSSVVGFDVSPDFVSYASQHNSSPNVFHHVADASDISTIKPVGAFSKVVSLSVLHWVQDMTVALKAQHSCLAIHAKPNGEIFVACQHDESKSYQTWLNMASHPNWKSYLTDFVPNLFPWPADDISSYSSRLLEECGFEVLSCHVKQHQQPFQFKEKLKETLRAIFPHLRYIPADKHEEFFDDLLEMAKDIHFISTDYTGTDGTLVLHARKL